MIYFHKKTAFNRPQNQYLRHHFIFISYLLFMKDQLYLEHITGRNFNGSVQIKGKTLSLNLTQFRKGGIYTMEITQPNIEKQSKRFLIFRRVTDLFDQIVQNKKLQISDENALIMPIDVIYKNKIFELKVQLPLLQKQFSNQAEKMQSLFETIEKMNKQLESNTVKYINFKGDSTNQRYNTFQVSQNHKSIKKIGEGYSCFNHFSPLKSQGIFSFQIKIVKTSKKYILIGICSKQIKDKTGSDLYFSPYFMGLYLLNGNLYGNGKNYEAASQIVVVQGKSVFKVQINMSKSTISWYHNDNKLYSTEIFKNLVKQSVCPMVALSTNGDIVQFLDQ